MKKIRIIRNLLVLFLLTGFSAKGQLTNVGLIVKFYDGTSFEDKQAVLDEFEALKPLKKDHDLAGFDVTLVAVKESFSSANYLSLKSGVESHPSVEFISILRKTEQGALGGDLQELYLKPKGEFNPLGLLESESLKSIEPHHFLENTWVCTVDKGSTPIRELQQSLNESSAFEFVSVNTLHSVLATVSDPYYENQWALENDGGAIHFDGTPGADMSVSDAWTLSTGNPDIKIAVLDSGTDTNHVDLVGNLLPGFDATGDGSLGYPNTTYSNDGHGTCCAGIIGALGDNSEGIAGIAYDCKIIPVKIFYYIEFGGDVIPFTSAEAGTDGIIWAVNTAKADVLSNSWGLRSTDIALLGIDTAMSNSVMTTNILNGREGKGTPMLFSSGNEGDNFSIWPASYPLTISVGASTMCDELKTPTDCSPEGWWGSNYGADLDVTAPGVKVLATDMTDGLGYNDFVDNNYSMFNGTSAACPNAAGVMALILSIDPELTSTEARGILSITADQTGGYDYDEPKDFGLWSEEMGYGRVNAYEAAYYASNFVGVHPDEIPNDWIAYEQNRTYIRLDKTENTEITVFNLLGAEVVYLFENQLNESVRLDDYITAPGMYLVQIDRDGHQSTLKAVVKK